MKWIMQIGVYENGQKWVSVKPSGNKCPYEYDSKDEAEKMLRICYGDAILCRGLSTRVITTEQANISP